MRKEKALNAINVRLTDSEYAEYLRLGGVKWMRLFLRQSIEMQETLAIERYEPKDKIEIKRRIRRAAQNSESRGTAGMVAVPKSVWQVVGKTAQATTEESDSRL